MKIRMIYLVFYEFRLGPSIPSGVEPVGNNAYSFFMKFNSFASLNYPMCVLSGGSNAAYNQNQYWMIQSNTFRDDWWENKVEILVVCLLGVDLSTSPFLVQRKTSYVPTLYRTLNVNARS